MHRPLSEAITKPIPARIDPQLATLRKGAPDGPHWLSEIKFDGYRMLCRIDRGKVSMISRRNLDWTKRLPDLSADLAKLPIKTAWLDGEVAALRPDGVSDFGALQSSFRRRQTHQLTYWAFDLLYIDGHDLRACALADRKQLLATVLKGAPTRVRLVEHVDGRAAEFLSHCQHLGLEGAVYKRADRPHSPGRNKDWLKVKCRRQEDFVIVGYLNPNRRRTGLGALLLGTIDADGTLHYAGRVGTGFSAKVESELLGILDRLREADTPIRKAPKAQPRMRLHWVRPELIAQVEFFERTDAGELRHPVFKGLRGC